MHQHVANIKKKHREFVVISLFCVCIARAGGLISIYTAVLSKSDRFTIGTLN